jgi:serine/threonine-protein kinase
VSDQARRLGERYELGEVIGRGGMAEVHEGRDLRLGRRVAVKILRPDLARDPAFQARFRREAQSAAALNHPNIVAVYDTGEDILGAAGAEPGTVVPYIVMEYVDGMTLRQLMSSGRRLLPERALEIADGTLAALDYSHRHGIVHRDIKPANVMLTRGGDVKVMDFGIARALADSGQTMTATSAVMGTAQYLSPEQARGELVDSRSDIYSTSCLVYELLTGRPPFTGDSPVSVAYQHVSEAPVPPSRLDPSIPTPIDAIVLKGLAKHPEDRYQTAADMRADVERAIAGLPVTASMAPVTATAVTDTAALPAVTGTYTTPPRKRSPWVWVGLGVGVVAVAAAAVILGKMIFGSPGVAQVAVPDLSGLTVTQASAKLSSVGLTLGRQTPAASPDRPKDTIISQNPPVGQQIDTGQAVDVTVSSGKATVPVPDLTNFTSIADVTSQLTTSQLVLGKVIQANSEQAVGTVIGQDPPAGTQVAVGTAVNVTVSNGKVPVPSVVNETQAQAQSDLANAGFLVNVVTQQTNASPPGTVLAQTPQGGTGASKGTLVTITVAAAVPPPPVSPTPSPSPSAT